MFVFSFLVLVCFCFFGLFFVYILVCLFVYFYLFIFHLFFIYFIYLFIFITIALFLSRLDDCPNSSPSIAAVYYGQNCCTYSTDPHTRPSLPPPPLFDLTVHLLCSVTISLTSCASSILSLCTSPRWWSSTAESSCLPTAPLPTSRRRWRTRQL